MGRGKKRRIFYMTVFLLYWNNRGQQTWPFDHTLLQYLLINQTKQTLAAHYRRAEFSGWNTSFQLFLPSSKSKCQFANASFVNTVGNRLWQISCFLLQQCCQTYIRMFFNTAVWNMSLRRSPHTFGPSSA